MIDFQPLKLSHKGPYEQILFAGPTRGCESSFANRLIWGRQQVAFLHDCVVFFSHFNGRTLYPYPLGQGDRRRAVLALMEDARERGIPCRITNLLPQDREELEGWFPGKFTFRADRDGFDYVYAIEDLAELKGRKYQKKRNHCHRFYAMHPEAQALPLTGELLDQAREMARNWYRQRLQTDPHQDFVLETVALEKAIRYFRELEMEGLALVENGRMLAMTMGSRLSADTFDIHFEKADEQAPEAYAAINQAFARYLGQKHPELRYLDREEDMGLEGLRKAKLSYHPTHLVEKGWVCCLEDVHGDCHP